MLSSFWSSEKKDAVAPPPNTSTNNDITSSPSASASPSQTPYEAKTGHEVSPLPTTMSCSQSFDRAMSCGGFTGSFRSLYRYGKWRDCSDQWSDFWFCMRVRSKPTADKETAIQEFYREKEEKIRRGPSSEDVWVQRDRQVVDFFEGDPHADGVFDALWVRGSPKGG